MMSPILQQSANLPLMLSPKQSQKADTVSQGGYFFSEIIENSIVSSVWSLAQRILPKNTLTLLFVALITHFPIGRIMSNWACLQLPIVHSHYFLKLFCMPIQAIQRI